MSVLLTTVMDITGMFVQWIDPDQSESNSLFYVTNRVYRQINWQPSTGMWISFETESLATVSVYTSCLFDLKLTPLSIPPVNCIFKVWGERRYVLCEGTITTEFFFFFKAMLTTISRIPDHLHVEAEKENKKKRRQWTEKLSQRTT